MEALTDFHRRLTDVYATSVEIEAGIIRFSEWLRELELELAKADRNKLQKPIAVIRGDPNSLSTTFQFKKTTGQLRVASMEEGRNIQFHRKGVIALTYALWEDDCRGKIASECNLSSKDEVISAVFADLNKYRQAILHVNGRLDRDPEILKFFVKGDVVEFSETQMHDLFAQLVEELNRIGGEYYEANPGFTFDSPIIRPDSPEAEQSNQADYLLLLLRDVRVSRNPPE